MKFITGSTSKGGHYLPGVISHGMLYVSGQLPLDPDTGKLTAGGVAEQTLVALQNVERVLTAAGATKKSVAMCRVYVSDIALWDQVNRVYADFFGSHMPARAVVPTNSLHHGALVEIEAIAEMEEG